MTRFDFYDRFDVEVRGQGNVAQKLRATFEHFAVPGDGTEPDLVIDVATESPDPDAVLGGSNEYYGVEGDRFVIHEGEDYFMVVDPDWSHIRVSPLNIHHHVAYLIEFEVRKRLVEEGKVLIHASGVETDGETLLFPAWRHAGKTNTMLTLLDDGADYLSDDRVWADPKGTVEGYPLPINVMSWNDDMFGFDPDLTRFQSLRKDASEFILEQVDMKRSIVDKMVYFFTNQIVALDDWYRLLAVEDLVPTAEYVPESTIDGMIFLRTSLDAPDNEVVVEEITAQDALSDLRTISYYEWNRRLTDYFGAYDMLFPPADRPGELEDLLDAEERIFGELVENVDVYRAHVPRERDWIETGIAEQIRTKLPAATRSADVSR